MKIVNPKKNISNLEKAQAAWKEFAPNGKFGNKTLADFDTAVDGSQTTRSNLVENDNERMALIVRRNNDDATALVIRELLVTGVVADPNFGPDSAFYEALGYIRKSARKSGLTRRKKQPTE